MQFRSASSDDGSHCHSRRLAVEQQNERSTRISVHTELCGRPPCARHVLAARLEGAPRPCSIPCIMQPLLRRVKSGRR